MSSSEPSDFARLPDPGPEVFTAPLQKPAHVGEDWLEVGGRRREFDPWTARVAADRAFVDELRATPTPASRRFSAGESSDSGEPLGLPDHGEALRTHRLACALARSAATGEPVAVP